MLVPGDRGHEAASHGAGDVLVLGRILEHPMAAGGDAGLWALVL